MVNQDCTHPSSERLVSNTNNLFFSMRGQQKCEVKNLFLSACLRAAVLAALTAAPGITHADPLATSACFELGKLTPPEIDAIRESIATGAQRSQAIIQQALERYRACMLAAVAADAAVRAAAAAAVAASIIPD